MRPARPGIGRSLLALSLTAGVTFADGERAPNLNQFDWIREFLQEFSVVTDGGASGPRDIISTRLDPHPDAGYAVLGYQRASYSGPDATSLQSQQLIQYTVRLPDITRDSVRVQAWDGFNADQTFWLVRADIAEEADFVSYTNVFERRLEDGSVDVTSSRGRVREIVLGYFTDATNAARLAENFRDMLAHLA